METTPEQKRDLAIKYSSQLLGLRLTNRSWGQLSSIDQEDLIIRAEKLDRTTQMVARFTHQADKPQDQSAQDRSEYQRRYYQTHKEQAKEYQRQYNATHKKHGNGGRGRKTITATREVVRSTFNASDIMHSPAEKTAVMLGKIVRGERLFTM